MNKVHEIFPLIVYQGSINSHEYMKKHIDVLREYWFDGYENESPEYSGRIFLHQEEYCKPFFKDLKTNVDEASSYSSDEESIVGINSRTDIISPLSSPAAQGISIVIEETDDNDGDNEDNATDNSGNIV